MTTVAYWSIFVFLSIFVIIYVSDGSMANICQHLFIPFSPLIQILCSYQLPLSLNNENDTFLFQEEDLFTMAYGLPLSVDGDEKCLSMLNAVEETISRQLRACKSSSKRRVLEGNSMLKL